MKVVIKKFVLILCLGSLICSNLGAMNHIFEDIDNKNNDQENKVGPIGAEVKKRMENMNFVGDASVGGPGENILKNLLFSGNEESPQKSKFMFQDPEMSEDFAKFIYEEACPEKVKKFIDRYQKLGDDAFVKIGQNSNFVLLYGPHGTGKSSIGTLIAKKLNLKPVFINSGFLGTTYKNSEEVNISQAIAPIIESGQRCVVVIDEADLISARAKDDERSKGNAHVAIGQMMDMLINKPNIIVVWTTNHFDQIDDKFKGMLSENEKIEILKPDFVVRKKIINRLLKEIADDSEKTKVKIICESGIDIDSLARGTEGFAIRNIRSMIRVSKDKAVDQFDQNGGKKEITITGAMLNEALDGARASVSNDNGARNKNNLYKFIKDYGLIAAFIGLGATVLGILANYHLSLKKMAIEKEYNEEKGLWRKVKTVGTLAIGTIFIGIAAGCLFLENPKKVFQHPIDFFKRSYFDGVYAARSLFFKKSNK